MAHDVMMLDSFQQEKLSCVFKTILRTWVFTWGIISMC